MEKEGVVLCRKSQETGGSRKMVKRIGKDVGMVVGRHGVGRLFDTAFFPGHDRDGGLDFGCEGSKLRRQ